MSKWTLLSIAVCGFAMACGGEPNTPDATEATETKADDTATENNEAAPEDANN